MALKPGNGLFNWELSVTTKLVGEYRRRSQILERYEFDDLVQDCLLHWITVRRSLDCDPANPPLGFMAKVLRNWLADLVRKRGTDKRFGDLDMPSLDATVDGSEDGMNCWMYRNPGTLQAMAKPTTTCVWICCAPARI
jgi:RNA polymerase sigma-70 factor (ECF subfamily)